MNKVNAAIYCRLSKEDADKISKGDESGSILNQKLLLADYAANHNFTVVKTYSDDDYSGLDKDRPQFKQMIKDAEKGVFEVIICKNQSRFTRDMEQVEKYLHGLFVIWGVRFIGVTDNVDTNIKGNKKARQINGLINEWYCEDLSDNIKAVFKKKMEDGQFLGPFACYGYEKNPKDRHKIIIDNEAARIVKEIFNLYLAGESMSKIANTLTERGILPPARYKLLKGMNFSRPNGFNADTYGVWSASTVKRILKNEAYIGTLIQGREKKISYKSNKVTAVPRDEWVIIKNNHEPVVDENTFYTASRLIEGRARRGVLSKEAYIKPHLLAGKVKCSVCGGVMQRSGKTRDGKSYYLRCKVKSGGNGFIHAPVYIRQDKIEDLLEKRIRKFIHNIIESESEAVKEIAIIKNEKVKKDYEIKKSELGKIADRITNITKTISALYADKVGGIITTKEFLSFKETFQNERKALFIRREIIEKELLAYEETINRSGIDDYIEGYKTKKIFNFETVNDFVESIGIGTLNKETGEREVIINWLF